MTCAHTTHRLFVGSYTEGTCDQGIYTLLFDEVAQQMRVVGQGGHAPNPSFVTVRGNVLFAAHESDSCGMLAAYVIAADGRLVCCGACLFPPDAGTCHVSIHPSGHMVYGANYESGSVCACRLVRVEETCAKGVPNAPTTFALIGGLPIVRHYGRSIHPVRQRTAHVHSTSFIPETSLVAAVDLGLDTITIYATDHAGTIKEPALQTIPLDAGSGPRMLAFHPYLPLIALINELGNDIMVFRYAQRAYPPNNRACRFAPDYLHWHQLERWALPERHIPANTYAATPLAAHIAFSPDGTFLYASARGSDCLAWFHLSRTGSLLTRDAVPCGGRTPRHFALSADGRFLAVANQDSNNVVMFARDVITGKPRELCHVSLYKPSCVAWA